MTEPRTLRELIDLLNATLAAATPRTLRELVTKWRTEAKSYLGPTGLTVTAGRAGGLGDCADELEAALRAATPEPRKCSYCLKELVPNVTACAECCEKYLHGVQSIIAAATPASAAREALQAVANDIGDPGNCGLISAETGGKVRAALAASTPDEENA